MKQRPAVLSPNCGEGVRLILGCGGSIDSFLLITTDPETNQQHFYWSDIWPSLAKQLNNCITKGRHVTHVTASNREEIWFIHGTKAGVKNHHWFHGVSGDQQAEIMESFDADSDLIGITHREYPSDNVIFVIGSKHPNGGYSYQGLDADFSSTFTSLYENRAKFHRILIGLGQSGRGYVISYSNGSGAESDGLGEYCQEEFAKQGRCHDVAVNTDGSWVIIRDNKYVASEDVSTTVIEHLRSYFSTHRSNYARRRQEIQMFDSQQRMEIERLEDLKVQREEERRLEQEKEDKLRKHLKRENLRKLKEEERIHQEQIDAQQKTAFLQYEIRHLHEELAKKKAELLKLGFTPDKTAVSSVPQAFPLCTVCNDSMVNTIVLPCNHVCMCETCSTNLTESPNAKCPICRSVITSKNKIYILGLT